MHVCVLSHVRLFATPWTIAHQLPLSMRFFQARILEWVAISSLFSSVQFSSVTQRCLTPCNPMDHSTPGLPVHHQLPEFTQTHVHQVGGAIQPSHPLLSLSLPALNPSQHQGLFQWVNSSHEVVKVLECQPQHQSSGPVSFRMNWLDFLAVQGTLKSLLQQFKSINSSVLSLLHNPTLISIRDHWKNHSLGLCWQSNVSAF